MTKIVYTAISKGYDSVKDPLVIDPEWEYLLFTDDPKVQSDYWKVILLPSLTVLDQRKIKTCPHLFFDYDQCVWIDGSMLLHGKPQATEHDIVLKKHPERSSVMEEIQACVNLGKDAANVMRQFEAYQEQLPYMNILFETGSIIRKRSQAVDDLGEAWYHEIEQWSTRDQISLPYVLKDFALNVQVVEEWPDLTLHAHVDGHDLPKVHYGVPYALDMNLGRAYNDFCESVPDGDWICLMDADSMFLTNNYGKLIAQTIKKNPEYSMFGCVTNRLRAKDQLVDGMYEDPNMLNHKKVAEYVSMENYTKVTQVDKPIAGLMMVFKKEDWKRNKFRNGLIGIDTMFGQGMLDLGLRIGVMQGVYKLHYYRMMEGKDSLDHLKSNVPNRLMKLDVSELDPRDPLVAIIGMMDVKMPWSKIRHQPESVKRLFK